jgi:hypothetical protein
LEPEREFTRGREVSRLNNIEPYNIEEARIMERISSREWHSIAQKYHISASSRRLDGNFEDLLHHLLLSEGRAG